MKTSSPAVHELAILAAIWLAGVALIVLAEGKHNHGPESIAGGKAAQWQQQNSTTCHSQSASVSATDTCESGSRSWTSASRN